MFSGVYPFLGADGHLYGHQKKHLIDNETEVRGSYSEVLTG
jgi:hypothetical protein